MRAALKAGNVPPHDILSLLGHDSLIWTISPCSLTLTVIPRRTPAIGRQMSRQGQLSFVRRYLPINVEGLSIRVSQSREERDSINTRDFEDAPRSLYSPRSGKLFRSFLSRLLLLSSSQIENKFEIHSKQLGCVRLSRPVRNGASTKGLARLATNSAYDLSADNCGFRALRLVFCS